MQGYRSGVSHLLADRGTQVESPQPISAPSIAQTSSPAFTAQMSFASNPNEIDRNGQTLSSEFEDVDSRDNVGACLTEQKIGSVSHNASLLAAEVEGKLFS